MRRKRMKMEDDFWVWRLWLMRKGKLGFEKRDGLRI